MHKRYKLCKVCGIHISDWFLDQPIWNDPLPVHSPSHLSNQSMLLAPCNWERYVGNDRQHVYRAPHSGIHRVCKWKKSIQDCKWHAWKSHYTTNFAQTVPTLLCIRTFVQSSQILWLYIFYWGYANVDFLEGPRTTFVKMVLSRQWSTCEAYL